MVLLSENEEDYVLTLKDKDFPSNFINFIHPEDYKIFHQPFNEIIYHRKKFHNRLFLRICFKLDNQTFTPITFILDTGSPMYFYLCPKAKEFLNDIIRKDEFDTEYIVLPDSKKFTVDDTPHVHENVNIIDYLFLEEKYCFKIFQTIFNIVSKSSRPFLILFQNLPDHF